MLRLNHWVQGWAQSVGLGLEFRMESRRTWRVGKGVVEPLV